MLGFNHRETLNIRENTALRCFEQGNDKEAEETFCDVLETRLSQKHNAKDMEQTRAGLAEVYKQQGSEKERRQRSWLLW